MHIIKRILIILTFLCTSLVVTAVPSHAACVEKANSDYYQWGQLGTTYRVHVYWTYSLCDGSNLVNPLRYGAHYSVVDGPANCHDGYVDGWRVNIGPFKQFNPEVLFVPCQADDYSHVSKEFGNGTFELKDGHSVLAEHFQTMVRDGNWDIGPRSTGYLVMTNN